MNKAGKSRKLTPVWSPILFFGLSVVLALMSRQSINDAKSEK